MYSKGNNDSHRLAPACQKSGVVLFKLLLQKVSNLQGRCSILGVLLVTLDHCRFERLVVFILAVPDGLVKLGSVTLFYHLSSILVGFGQKGPALLEEHVKEVAERVNVNRCGFGSVRMIFFGRPVLSGIFGNGKGARRAVGLIDAQKSSPIKVIELVAISHLDPLSWRNVRVGHGSSHFAVKTVHCGKSERGLRCNHQLLPGRQRIVATGHLVTVV
mmetsp:Transcript_19996/g.55161  ORF Transcript_19996/g.55161 Transcript_19996/m.55161 type:complete len:216 (+) Transcript_19996:2064-2711(+)